MRQYPRLIVDMKKLRGNVRAVNKLCENAGIFPAFVIKGCNGIPEAIRAAAEEGAEMIGSSRLEQLKRAKEIAPDIERLMLRIPAPSEAADVVEVADISLVSSLEALEFLDAEAGKQHKKHQVILMADLGDLREGFWETDELVQAAMYAEQKADNLILTGVGTNLGCYGAIDVTVEKMDELVQVAETVESAIGRKLKYISGGGTTSIPRVLAKDMHPRVNMLRIGEGWLSARDLEDIWHCSIPGVEKNAFILEAEISEVRDKASYPQGVIKCDAFGNVPTYEDRGIRKRAIASAGKVDYGYPEMLEPLEEGIEVLGASSDHTLLDIQEAKRELKIGDIVKFGMKYANTVFVTGREDIAKNIIE